MPLEKQLYKVMAKLSRSSSFLNNLKVAEHSFDSLGVYVICQSWQEKGCSSQAETWQVKNILMKDFD